MSAFGTKRTSARSWIISPALCGLYRAHCLLICQLIQSFRRLGLGFGGSPVYGLKRALDAMWLPDNTVSEIEKTHKQSGSPHRLSRSRNSLATVGAPFR